LAIGAINGINNLNGAQGLSKINLTTNNSDGNKDSTSVGQTSFNDFLGKALDNLNQSQQVAESDKLLLASGQANNLPQIMVDAQKAELSLQFATQIRNKAVDAYNEIMRIQM
jgi:flagellar hook-basal body complex protein FliE